MGDICYYVLTFHFSLNVRTRRLENQNMYVCEYLQMVTIAKSHYIGSET